MINQTKLFIADMQNLKYLIAVLLYFGFVSISVAGKPELIVNSFPVSCFGKADGKLEVNIKENKKSYIIKVFDRTPATKQKIIAQAKVRTDTTIIFEKLASKLYYVVVEDQNKFLIQKKIFIEQPQKLIAEAITIEKESTGEGNNDAILKANISGGTPPYSFLWSQNANSQITQLAYNIGYGTYYCKINDSTKCGPVTPTIYYFLENMNIQKN